ncbi:uncharacterized protein BDZ99DRAFT_459079 [Mytilinidion resinicola]|uniref:HTH CENPB-type domain-containing protein n=1 Tax=Mytilinidion resinicola TaxID=574789 RepID=A0A6A6Z4F7_9PEZI|nr:uncharacterized protein BDZ99DRAFT_459079 [Mytilinidion resinicola]KAF2815137.1 hypothetical protein BDZ99DRAFT_459079 [Mytilinidion resinicola]
MLYLAPLCGIVAADDPQRKTKAESQQYLTPSEEKALVIFLLRMAALGFPVRIKFIPSLAFSLARRRSANKVHM